MRELSRKKVEAAKRRAELAAANLMDDESRADEFADMSVEDYADLRDITINNPKKGGLIMASRIKELESELAEANERIEDLESERAEVLDALGLEIVDNDEDYEESESEEE